MILSPSLLSPNFANLQADVEMLNKSAADWFHIDVMDGVFVPNISFGFPVLKSIQPIAQKPFDVHLMIVNPEKYIERFKTAGAEILTVHYEACSDLKRTIEQIHANGMKAGVAIKPHTDISVLTPAFGKADMFLIMTVEPGFGGQKYMDMCTEKIARLREYGLGLNEKTTYEKVIKWYR